MLLIIRINRTTIKLNQLAKNSLLSDTIEFAVVSICILDAIYWAIQRFVCNAMISMKYALMNNVVTLLAAIPFGNLINCCLNVKICHKTN